MTTYSKTKIYAERPPSFGMGKFLFAVFLAAILFLLGQCMVRHNFHQGQRVHKDYSIGQ